MKKIHVRIENNAILDILNHRETYTQNTISTAKKYFSLADGITAYANIYGSFTTVGK